jgi:TPP-dependent pyruvate/acetoin dehydrogenase alpha subunit
MDQPKKYTRAQFIEKVRSFELRLLENMKDVFVPTHLSLGQEGVAADLYECLRPGDWLFSTHRNHHHYLAKGGKEQALWDEIMGLPTGINGGFAGSQAITEAAINFHSSAIVGGLVGVAAGTAYALKGSGQVVVCCTGDGGTEAGVFWESLNFAALYKLPIAYICENNGKSVDAKIAERQATPLGPRVSAFGIRVCNSVQYAVASARQGVPSFHEAKVTLECEHIYCGALSPKEVIA